MSDARDPHAWFRARMGAHHAGLLEDADEERFRTHLVDCEECRGLLEAPESDLTPADLEHIPVSVLVTWRRARATFGTFERSMIERHLRSCEQCRADLELLGDIAPAPNVAPIAATGQLGGHSILRPPLAHYLRTRQAAAAGRQGFHKARGVWPGLRHWDRRVWFGIAAAAVILVVTIAVPWLRGKAPLQVWTERPSGNAMGVPPAGWIIELLAQPPAGALIRRAAATTVVDAPAGAHSVMLDLPPLNGPQLMPIAVELQLPSGEIAVLNTLPPGSLAGVRAVRIAHPAGAMPAGAYTLILRAGSTGGAVPQELKFRVRATPGASP